MVTLAEKLRGLIEAYKEELLTKKQYDKMHAEILKQYCKFSGTSVTVDKSRAPFWRRIFNEAVRLSKFTLRSLLMPIVSASEAKTELEQKITEEIKSKSRNNNGILVDSDSQCPIISYEKVKNMGLK
nr:7926_t:CDS:2 [Entrophospora candida]